MLLKSLEMSNIRSYDRLHLEFPSGYVLLSGDVGSGKSTILMAIEFALFGLGNIKGDRLLSKGQRRGEVVLTFEADGMQYEVGRTLVEKNGNVGQDPKGLYLEADGTREPLTAADLKTRVLQILNFRESVNPRTHSRVYRYAVYTPQEEIKSILEGAGREDVIRKAFGMEDYKTATDNAVTLCRHISSEKDKLTGRFAKLGEYRAERQGVAGEIASLEDEVAGLGRTRDVFSSRLADIRMRQDRMEAQMKELVRIREEKNQAERDIASRRETLKKLMENIQGDRRELDRTRAELERLGTPKKPADHTHDELAGMLDRIEKTERDIHAKQSEAASCTKDMAGINESLDSLGIPKKPADHTYDELAGMLDRIEKTERDIHAKQSEAASCTKDMAGINESLDSLGIPKKPADHTHDELAGMLDRIEKTERDIHAKQSEAASCTKDMAGINESLDSLGIPKKPADHTHDELAGMLDRIEKTERDIHAKQSEAASCTKDMAGINESLDSLGIPKKPADHTHDELAGMLDRIEKTERDIHAKQSEAASCAKDMAGINESLDSLGIPKKPADHTHDELAGMLDRIEKTERDIHAKQSEAASCTKDMAGINESLDSLGIPKKPADHTHDELAGMLDRIEKTERDIHAKQSEAASCTKDMASLDEQLGGKNYTMIQNAISALEALIQSNEHTLSSTEQSVRDHNNRVGAKRNEIEMLRDSLQKAKQLGARCEHCDSVLEPEYVEDLLTHRKTRLASAESELHNLELELKDDSKTIIDIRDLLEQDRKSLETCKRDESVAGQKKTLEDRLASLNTSLAALDPEDNVPAGQPLSRSDGESPRDYLRRLMDTLREYESDIKRMGELEARKKTLEDRLASLNTSLAALDPEDNVPAGQPLSRSDGESPRDYLRRLMDTLREYESDIKRMGELEARKKTLEDRLASLNTSLAALDPEDNVPAGQPLSRSDGESPRDYLRRLMDTLREYESDIKRMGELEARKKTLEDRLASLNTSLAALDPEDNVPAGQPLSRSDGESPRDYLRRLMDTLREYESDIKRMGELEARKKTLEDRLASLNTSLAALDPEDNVPAGQPLSRSDGESPRDYLRRLMDTLREYESDIKRMGELEARKKTLEDRLASLNTSLAALDPEDNVPAGQPLSRSDGESPRDYLRRLMDTLREYESDIKRMGELEARKKTLEDRLASLNTSLAALDPEDNVPAGQPLSRSDGESPRDYLRRLMDTLREYESDIAKVSVLTQQRVSLESILDKNKELHGQEARYIQSREVDLRSADARLRGYDKLERDMENNRIERDRTQAELDQKTNEMSVAGERVRSKKERADQLDADIREAEEHMSRYELYQDHEEWLDSYFIPSVHRIEKSVMESLRYDFNEFYEDWYSKLVDDPTKRSRVDERFAPVLEQDGYQQSIDSLSGGEKTSVALAYRLAINSTMRRQTGTLSSNLLILDEPTDGFSREQMVKVREILDSLKSEQIIMVSHEKELEGYVEHVFRVTKSEGSSTVQKVRGV